MPSSNNNKDFEYGDDEIPERRNDLRPGRKPKKKQEDTVTNNLKYKTRSKLEKLRDLRMNRMPPYLIMREMNLSRKAYNKLMDYLMEEDGELMQLMNKNRLQTEIARCEGVADIVIKANIDIVNDANIPPSDRQESSKIAFDTAVAVVKLHSEGPRILNDVFDPIGPYLQIQGKQLPLPQSQQHREKEFTEKYDPQHLNSPPPNNNGSSIPPSYEKREES